MSRKSGTQLFLFCDLVEDRWLDVFVGVVAVADRLRVADEEVAALVRALIKLVDDGLRGGLLEVDHHVPAEDDVVHVRRKGVHEVELAERHDPADVVADLIVAVRQLGHVVFYPVRRHTAQLALRVLGLAGRRERAGGDVRRCDGDTPGAALDAERAVHRHGDIVGLLARAASGAPDAQRVFLSRRDLGDDCPHEEVVVLHLAVEIGVICRDLVEKAVDRGGVGLEHGDVLLIGLEAVVFELACQPRFDKLALLREINAVASADKLDDIIEFVVLEAHEIAAAF